MAEREGGLGKGRGVRSVGDAWAVHAPVVVMGAAGHQRELDTLVAAGAADFVEHGGRCLPMALERVERRLQHAQQGASKAKEVVAAAKAAGGEGFRGILRPQMNNSPTGLLGDSGVFGR